MKSGTLCVLISTALHYGCAAGPSHSRAGFDTRVFVGRVTSTDEVERYEAGGHSVDHWTAHVLESVAKPDDSIVALGYDRTCPSAGDTESTYQLRLQSRPAGLLIGGALELRNEWFIVSCERQ